MANAPSGSDNVSGRSSNYYETLSETVEEENNNNNNEPRFSKKDRKKLKKLKKRAALVLVESERSGLLTPSEHEEYQSLVRLEKEGNLAQSVTATKETDNASNNNNNNKPIRNYTPTKSISLARPIISLRKKCEGIERVEGSTHRDLLSWLLQQKFDKPQQQQSRKRSRDSSSSKPEDAPVAIPHWASIHNPGTCDQVAVLEAHVLDDNIEAYVRVLESCRGKNEIQENNSENENDKTFPSAQLGVATKWFQGHLPKSMSETLLYFSNARKEHKNKKNQDDSSFPSRNEFIKRLETLLLSPKELNEQGYPRELSPSTPEEIAVVNTDIKTAVSRKETIQSPDSISSEKAKEYVASFGVRVESQNEEDKSPYISTLTSTEESNGDISSNEECPVRVFGLDCEMVLTTVGSELARVTLLEFDEFVGPKISSKTTVLLDCLVLPENSILDYLTKHSGITPTLLEPISTRLQQVQCALASYLTPNDILIGHSLENDLRALHYIHPRIVDTSMIFRPMDQNKRFKFSLRHLSGTLLAKPIQTGSHCSEEDAQTALDLALLKALRGDDLRVPGFGDNQRQSLLRQQFMKDSVAAFIGPNHWLEAHITKHPNGAHALNYDSPHDCKKAMLAWMTNKRKAHLVWSKIELEKKASCLGQSSLEVFRSIVVSLHTRPEEMNSVEIIIIFVSTTLLTRRFDFVTTIPDGDCRKAAPHMHTHGGCSRRNTDGKKYVQKEGSLSRSKVKHYLVRKGRGNLERPTKLDEGWLRSMV